MQHLIWVTALGLAGLSPVSATAETTNQQSVNQACSSEADRLGLHGPERYDFRANCKNQGASFKQKSMSDDCRQVIVENGISGRASEKIEALQNINGKTVICQQVALMKAAQSKAVSSLEHDPNHCGYTQAQIDQLRANLSRLRAPCRAGASESGL